MRPNHGSGVRRWIDGVLLLDKPVGPSSNQVLQRVKRIFNARKAGHAGTLDPLATGLLPVLFGEATKFASYLSDAYKTYDATILLGVTTSTGDLAGEVLQRMDAPVSAELVRAAVRQFVGEITQVPPMHSAIKVHGTPLYALARRGEVVPREPRTVYISELSLLRFHGDELDICVRCSKGTYIRVLAEDIGRALGCGATLKNLRRTAVDGFRADAAISLDALEALDEAQRLDHLLGIDALVLHLPAIRLNPGDVTLVRQGQAVSVGGTLAEEQVARLYDADSGEFLGLGRMLKGSAQPIRLIQSRPVEMS